MWLDVILQAWENITDVITCRLIGFRCHRLKHDHHFLNNDCTMLTRGGICIWSIRARVRKRQCVTIKKCVWFRKETRLTASPHLCCLSETCITAFWWWEETDTDTDMFHSDPLLCWSTSHVFHRIPSSSSVWLVLMDTTCAFPVFCAWNKVGGNQGSVWAHTHSPSHELLFWWSKSKGNMSMQNI